MGYVYEKERPGVLTDDGQRRFLKIRDRVKALLAQAGAFRMQEAISGLSGSDWTMIACVDRLVELGEIVELTPHPKVHTWGQNRIFTDGGYKP